MEYSGRDMDKSGIADLSGNANLLICVIPVFSHFNVCIALQIRNDCD